MGSITNRGTKGAPKFYASFVDVDGVRRMKRLKGALNQEHARTLLAAIERNVLGGKAGLHEPTMEEREARTVTVRQLADRFLGDVDGAPGYAPPKIKSVENYRRGARTVLTRVLPTMGSRAAASVSLLDVERMRDALTASGLSASSVTQALAVLSKIYNWARREKLVDCANPVQGVERPRALMTVDYLTRDEAARLLAKAEELARASPSFTHEARVRWPMVTAAVYTGMRKGELLGLRWTDVHFDAKRVDVMRSYELLPKGGKPRHLPLHPELARVLRLWREECRATDENLVFPVEPACDWPLRMGVKLDGLGLKDVLAAADCHAPVDGKPWHLLRHTFASHSVMSGTSLYEVQRLLGHSTPTMTQRYAHLAPDHLAGAVARLDFSQHQAGDVASLDDERRKRTIEASSPIS